MRSDFIAASIVALVMVVGIGVLIPYKFFDLVAIGAMDIWLAVILSILIWLGVGATVIAIIAIASGTSMASRWTGTSYVKEKSESFSMTAYRARQRAMLEELDEAIKLLRDIRDILKEAGE